MVINAKDGFARFFMTSIILVLSDESLKKIRPGTQEDMWHEFFIKFDGESVPVDKFFKLMDERIEEQIRREACKLYTDRFDRKSEEIEEKLGGITEELENIAECLKKIRREKFPDVWFYGDDDD